MRLSSLNIFAAAVVLFVAAPAGAQLINEAFDDVTVPALPAGWTIENANGDTNEWRTLDRTYVCSGNSAYIHYNGEQTMDDWLFTPGVALTAGSTYTLTFNHRVSYAIYPENLAVYIGTSASSGAMATQLIDLPGMTNETCQLATITDFTVPTAGTYYIGFYGYSPADRDDLIVDDVVLVDTTLLADGFESGNTSAWSVAIGEEVKK